MKYFNVLTCLVLLWIEYSILLDVVVDVLWDSKNYKLKKIVAIETIPDNSKNLYT